MNLSIRLIFAFAMLGLYVVSQSLKADTLDYSASIAIKTQYLGKIGTTVDDNNVVQPYLEINHESGLYGYLWLNLPLKQGNPKRSFEFEPSIGYRSKIGEWHWDAAVTLFDLQNPKTLDFSGDVLSPNFKLSRGIFYAEAFYYAFDGGDDGRLLSVGVNQTIGDRTSLSSNVTYVNGPIHFEPIVYVKVTASVSLEPMPFNLFAEVMEIVKEESDNESRTDQVALGLRYFF